MSILALAAAVTTLMATPLTEGKNDRQPGDEATRSRLAAKEDSFAVDVQSLDALIEPIRKETGMPAMAVAVVTADGPPRLIGRGASGFREAGGATPVGADDLWHLGSCTKAFTATLCAQLVDEGLLRWTSTIGEVLGAGLPELHAGWKEVTLADLLRHLGGVPGKPPPEMWQAAWSCKGPASECRAEFIAKILAQAPQRQRGTFEYSNQGYAIAGRMCEVVTKATWEDLVRRRVCEPLGISSLGFGVPSAREAERSPKGHGPTGALLDIDNPNAIAPAGTMHMTISDWARFAAFHAAAKPDPRMRMSEASFAELHTSPKDAPQPVAMGWFPAERSWGRGTVLSHAGSNNSWFCVAWIAPARRFAVVVTCNRGGDLASSACDRAVGEAIRWFDSFEAAKKPSAPATNASEPVKGGS